jgi:hypothetical protein
MKKIMTSLILSTAIMSCSYASVTNSVYGWVQVFNNSQDANMEIKPLRNKSSHGQFLISKEKIVIPARGSEWIQYQLDWGLNNAVGSSANLSCDATFDADLGLTLFSLVFNGNIGPRFETKADCEAALNLKMSTYTGIIADASLMASVKYITLPQEDGAVAGRKGGLIHVSSSSASTAKIGAKRPDETIEDSRWFIGKVWGPDLTNITVQPAWNRLQQPTSSVSMSADFSRR